MFRRGGRPAGDDNSAMLAEHARALAEVVAVDLPAWVSSAVLCRRADLVAEAGHAAWLCSQTEVVELRRLLAQDPEDQRRTPLEVIRLAVRHPTEVLDAAGYPRAARDDFAVTVFPDDHFDLSPASWRDISDRVAEAGIAWGAAKAYVHLARRRDGMT